MGTIIDLLITGSAGCGKTSLVKRFMGKEFSEEYIPTKFISNLKMKFKVDDGSKPDILLIKDADGERKYESYSINYYTTSDIIVIVYDISNQLSMEGVTTIHADVERYCRYDEAKKPCCILVGNKSDMSREINKTDAENFAEKNKLPHIETSAKTNANVEEMFKLVIKRFKEMKNVKRQTQHHKDSLDETPGTPSAQPISEPAVTSTDNSSCSCTIC